MTAPSSNKHSSLWQPSAQGNALRLRAQLLAQARRFFEERAILEVETPLLSHAGAADAHLAQFIVNDSDDGPFYLQTSPEYAMKRLLIANNASIYQICKAFRQGEAGPRHNPEFTLMEWYRIGFDDHMLAAETCELIMRLVNRPLAPTNIVKYTDLFQQTIGLNPTTASIQMLRQAAQQFTQLPTHTELDTDGWLNLLMTVAVETQLPPDRLTVVTDYPASQAIFARINAAGYAARFEIYCGALELANGFYEAATREDYLTHFQHEATQRLKNDLPTITPDHYLLDALAHQALPDCAGVAVGFDRLVMLAGSFNHIQDTLAFSIDRI